MSRFVVFLYFRYSKSNISPLLFILGYYHLILLLSFPGVISALIDSINTYTAFLSAALVQRTQPDLQKTAPSVGTDAH